MIICSINVGGHGPLGPSGYTYWCAAGLAVAHPGLQGGILFNYT